MRDLFTKWSSEPVTDVKGRVTLSEQKKPNNINKVTNVTDVTEKSRQSVKKSSIRPFQADQPKNTDCIKNGVTSVTSVTCLKLQDNSCSATVTEPGTSVTTHRPDLAIIMAESIRCCDCEHFKPVSFGDQRNGLGSCLDKPWDGFRGQWPRKVHQCPAYSEKGDAA
jgi:hypothetical protein